MITRRPTAKYKKKENKKYPYKKGRELIIGTRIEMEHARLFPKAVQRKMARKIAQDHIKEFPQYYSKGLIPMEKKLKKNQKGGNK